MMNTKYCRCSIFTKDKITFPCYVQLKCDGSYREMKVKDGKVSFVSRQGKEYVYPKLEKDVLDAGLLDGYYLGEFTIGDAFHAMNRFEGNGILNRKDCPERLIHFTVWDYLTLEDYEKCTEEYKFRYVTLQALQYWFPEWMSLVDTHVVYSLDDIIKFNSVYMSQGLEGSVIKLTNYVFKNGTSNKQFKLKLKVDADVRITGTTKGEGKYSDTIGAITFSTDDSLVTGKVSGMTDTLRRDIGKNPSKYIGKIMSVEFNDLTPENNLSHPRFKEIREDKSETDTLERITQMRDMARKL